MSLLLAASARPALLSRSPFQGPRVHRCPAAFRSANRSAAPSCPARATRMAVTAGMGSFEQKLAQLPDASYILFKADWCPDCVRSTDAVKSAVAAAGAQLLLVDVADQPAAWKASAHPLRCDPRFQLAGIPTLVLWKGGKAAAKLGGELEKAPNTRAAAEVAAAFVKANQ